MRIYKKGDIVDIKVRCMVSSCCFWEPAWHFPHLITWRESAVVQSHVSTFLGYRNGPERNASQVLSWQNRTCVQCNPACCWHHCQQAGQVSGIFWFFKLFIITIDFLTWHPFASLALKPLVGGVWPHFHFATRAVYVVSGHSCGGKHFTLELPSQTLVCSGSVIRKQHCEYWIVFTINLHLFCELFINLCVCGAWLIVLTQSSFISEL